MVTHLSLHQARRGAILIWLLVALAVIIGILALGMDGGRMMDERRRAQAAADAAAMAAAADLYQNHWQNQGLDPNGTAKSAALTSAAMNGYSNDGVQNTVTVNVPPTSGTFIGQAGYIEVIIQSNLSTGFGRVFTQADLPVQSRSVAIGQPVKIGLILLRKTGSGAFFNTAAAFTLVNAPIIVNSTDPAAYNQNGFGVILAQRYDIAGGYINPGGGTLILGTVRTNVRPDPDPLAYLPVPDMTTAIVRSSTPLVINSLIPTTLQPGIYRGGIQVTGASVVIMQPGVYIMDGGGFNLAGAAAVTGLEVMIYNTSVTYPAASIQIASAANVLLAAPLSGTYQGIGLFQDRSLTNTLTITSAGLTTITGVVYAAQGPVSLTGSAVLGVNILGGAYVCDSMQVQGLGSISVNLGLNPPRVPEVHLVE